MAHDRGSKQSKTKRKAHFIHRLHWLERIMVAGWCVRACVRACTPPRFVANLMFQVPVRLELDSLSGVYRRRSMIHESNRQLHKPQKYTTVCRSRFRSFFFVFVRFHATNINCQVFSAALGARRPCVASCYHSDDDT